MCALHKVSASTQEKAFVNSTPPPHTFMQIAQRYIYLSVVIGGRAISGPESNWKEVYT